MAAQKDLNFFIKTVAVTDNWLAYIEKQLNDVEKFCCKATDSSILAVNTIFNLYDMWITGASYWNMFLLNANAGKAPVQLGPITEQFTKNEKIFLGLH